MEVTFSCPSVTEAQESSKSRKNEKSNIMPYFAIMPWLLDGNICMEGIWAEIKKLTELSLNFGQNHEIGWSKQSKICWGHVK